MTRRKICGSNTEINMIDTPYKATRTLLFIAVTMLVMSGCASGPDVFINEDPSADFGAYKTYGFPPALSTDKAGGYSSLLSQYLKVAVSREMDARGYTESENPDLVVNFYLHTEEKIKTTQTPTSSAYYGYRGGRYGTWGGYGGGMGYETRVTQYTEGTLNVDLVDNNRDQLVWEAAMVGKISQDVMSNLESKVDEAIAELFVDYRYRAGSATPVYPTAD